MNRRENESLELQEQYDPWKFIVQAKDVPVLDAAITILSHKEYGSMGQIQMRINLETFDREIEFIGDRKDENPYWNRLHTLYHMGIAFRDILETLRGRTMGIMDESLLASSLDMFARMEFLPTKNPPKS